MRAAQTLQMRQCNRLRSQSILKREPRDRRVEEAKIKAGEKGSHGVLVGNHGVTVEDGPITDHNPLHQ